MSKYRSIALCLLILGGMLGYYVYYSEVNPTSSWAKPFKLGLDLKGGTHLVYEADTTKIQPSQVNEAMTSLREVVDRRVNVFGVTEPLVYVEQAGVGDNAKQRLAVDLPGVTDVNQALQLISKTPTLEFKTERPAGAEKDAIIAAKKSAQDYLVAHPSTTIEAVTALYPQALEDADYIDTPLSGRFLKKATVGFANQGVSQPTVNLEFNPEGAKMFADITAANVDKTVAIYLDGVIISAPNVREAIKDGNAEISGKFTVDEAKQLVRDLNLGALPVPIKLVSTETIGATLGADALNKGIMAGLIGLLIIALFMIIYYRLPGLVSVVSLMLYVTIMTALFKIIPVTLTAAGIAGFILSLGIAVDANVLIFERLKEELRKGKAMSEAVNEGFARAWLSIRDSNLSSLISAIVLFWFGSSLIKGFALTLALGIIVSMFTAIVVTRTFLKALGVHKRTKVSDFLFGSGISNS